MDPDYVYAEALGAVDRSRAAWLTGRRHAQARLARPGLVARPARDAAARSSSTATRTLLARAVAARLVTALVDAQAARGSASVVLTGGGIGIATLRELAASPARDAVDWDALDVWWGDERFLPAGTRNATRRRRARRCSTTSTSTPPACIRWPRATGRTATTWTRRRSATPTSSPRRPGRRTTDRCRRSTCCCSASAPDGHVASLFPGSPRALRRADRHAGARRTEAATDPAVAVDCGASTPRARCGSSRPARRRPRAVRMALSGAGRDRGAGSRRARPGPDALAARPGGRQPRCPPSLARIASP